MTTSSRSSKSNAEANDQAVNGFDATAPVIKAPAPIYGPQAALMGLDLYQSNLRSSRALLDMWRSVLRIQQDMMIGLLRQQLGATAATSAETGAPVKETFIWPFAAAASAYESTMATLMRTEQDATRYVTEAGRRAR